MSTRHARLAAFAQVVRTYRKTTGFSQERFAYEAGLDRAGYGRLERGEGNLTYLNVRKLLIGLGVTWRDFGAALHEIDALLQRTWYRSARGWARRGADV